MASRADGISLLSTLINFGAMTAFLVLHVSVVSHYVIRNGSRRWLVHLVVPLIGFAILLYVVINAKVAAQTLGIVWLGVGVIVLISLYAAGRRPKLPDLAPEEAVTDLRRIPARTPTNCRTPSAAGRRCAGYGPATWCRCTPRTASAGWSGRSTTCPRQVCNFPYLNPVTGPFHVEGAEPGDTLALHFVEIAPARDWAVTTTLPALRRADRHAHHGDPAGAAGGAGLALRGGRRRRYGPLPGQPLRLHRRAAAGPDARHGRGGAGRRSRPG